MVMASEVGVYDVEPENVKLKVSFLGNNVVRSEILKLMIHEALFPLSICFKLFLSHMLLVIVIKNKIWTLI